MNESRDIFIIGVSRRRVAGYHRGRYYKGYKRHWTLYYNDQDRLVTCRINLFEVVYFKILKFFQDHRDKEQFHEV